MSEFTGRPSEPRDAEQTRMEFPSAPAAPAPPSPDAVRLRVDEDGVGWIVFDTPGATVNLLTTPVMETLRDLIDQAMRRDARALVFVSDTPDCFLAGADVNEIGAVADPREGMEKAAYGQSVFEAIARYPGPTVAVLAGACVGGGYELALACGTIVAEDLPAVRIGLPEVKLGILPGFGGTQRLPARAGLPVALDVILGGKVLPARRALRRGLVDELVPPGRGRGIAREIALGTRPPARRKLPLRDTILSRVEPARRFALSRAHRRLAERVDAGQYPAPFLALEAIAGSGRNPLAGYRGEAERVGQALVTETCKNLTWLFLEQKRRPAPDGLPLGDVSAPRRLAVIGAGVMGGGIAWLAAEKGIPVRVKDVREDALAGALRTASELWEKDLRRRRITARERDRRLEALSFTLDTTGLRHVDLAVEAVVEDLAVKRAVIAELEGALGERALIATNTSSLKVGDIAAEASRPERVVGLHFFNPVDRMPLVEVVRGPRSAPEAVAAAYRFAESLGKTPILVADGPGFLVNRLLARYLGEALALFESGVGHRELDDPLVAFGLPMGPLALLDQIGIDTAEKVVRVMRAAFGDRLPAQVTLGRLASGGHFGKKSGRGFYAWNEDGRRGPASAESFAAAGSPTPRTMEAEEIVDRLLLPMVDEAARCLDEGVVARPVDVDLGMVLGTGFPPFRGGLLRWADRRGVPAIARRLEGLAAQDPRLAPSAALLQRERGFHA